MKQSKRKTHQVSTVAELIRVLQDYPSDTPLFMHDGWMVSSDVYVTPGPLEIEGEGVKQVIMFSFEEQ